MEQEARLILRTQKSGNERWKYSSKGITNP